MDLQPVLDRTAAIKYVSKYASKPEVASDSYHQALGAFCAHLPRHLPAERAAQSLFAKMAADRDISAQEAVHLLLGEKLVGCSRSFVNLNADDDAARAFTDAVELDDEDVAFKTTFFERYRTRPAQHEQMNAVQFCKTFDVNHGQHLPTFTPSSPSELTYLSAAPATTYRLRRREVIVRTWPRPSAVPADHDPTFDKWALSQLRLHKPFRNEAELRTPSVRQSFHSHLVNGGFPDFPRPTCPTDTGDDSDESQTDVDLASGVPPILEATLRQDDYQQVMHRTHTNTDNLSLLGFRELDLAHEWPASWLGIPFNRLLSWLSHVKDSATLLPPHLTGVQSDSLSIKQQQALDLITEHVFGPSKHEQLLMVVLGTAGTGKSYLINAVRQAFAQREELHSLRVTAPTGIAAANISGSTIHSLLSLLNENVTGSRLNTLQNSLRNVRLLIIDEYSFLSIPAFDSLDRQLRKIIPIHADRPFGGLNIVLCGDPAQLAPVCGQPVYADQDSNTPRPTRFHLFRTVVELDQPFRQTGSDDTQVRFRQVLGHIADCRAFEEDWIWLQSRRSCSLSPSENAIFNTNRHIVSTNKARKLINNKHLEELAPIMNIAGFDDGLHDISTDNIDDDSLNQIGPQLFAIGAEVMLTANLWTEAGLVNGSCGVVDDIIKPPDDRRARIIMVNFPGYRGPCLSPSRPSVVPITQVRAANQKGMPLTLAWAVTIHKSQGMTLDHVTVDLGNSEFASGLTFVALSRAKTFDGLRVEPFDFDRFKRIEKGRHVAARRAEFQRLRMLAATVHR